MVSDLPGPCLRPALNWNFGTGLEAITVWRVALWASGRKESRFETYRVLQGTLVRSNNLPTLEDSVLLADIGNIYPFLEYTSIRIDESRVRFLTGCSFQMAQFRKCRNSFKCSLDKVGTATRLPLKV
ncbi:hypothetical protein CDAR_429681 [Caerostris darwini]|uniref:Uncharacterized protein n=1 Tax=Caerostris darwini TaxID=1538125 RepID=A0AAV4VT94_9ARAC|nr:hypothetical protein CDAR_429681 [Caerostris darwini]